MRSFRNTRGSGTVGGVSARVSPEGPPGVLGRLRQWWSNFLERTNWASLGLFIGAPLIGVVLIGIALGLIGSRTAGSAAALSAATEPFVVKRGTLASTVSARGTVVLTGDARLNFPAPGRLKEIRVTLGQSVKAGDVLATLQDDDLQLRLEQARSAERLAAITVQTAAQAASGPVPTDATPVPVVAQAGSQGAAGSSSLEVQAAQAEVLAAQSRLTSAQSTLAQLSSGPSPSDLARADAAVATANANLQKATADLASLKAGASPNDVQLARLEVARTKQSLAAVQASRSSACAHGSDQCRAADAQIAAASLAAQQAQIKLQKLQQGPTPDDVAAATSNVESAQRSVSIAEAQRQQLIAGPTEADLLAAQLDVDAAEATLKSAQANLQEVQVRAQEEAYQAHLNVRLAELALDGATLRAPFDGVITNISARVGEWVGPNVTSSISVLTVTDPHAVRVDIAVDGQDAAQLSPGQVAKLSLRDTGSRQLTGRVAALPIASQDQGPATYTVPIQLDPTDARLVPGSAADVSISVQSRQNALLVPSRAIRQQSNQAVVEVSANGQRVLRPVSAGVSDGKMTEVLDGLSDGDVVMVPSDSTAPTGVAP